MPSVELFHRDEGTGTGAPVVFIHGFLCHHGHWQPQRAHFAQTRRVISCDLRGHGQSPRGTDRLDIETLAGDVVSLLERQDVRGAVLVGHSMGTRVIIETYLQAPDRVAGLVLVDGSGSGGDVRAAARDRFAAAIAERGYQTCVRELFEGMFFGDAPPWKQDLLDAVLAVPEATGSELYQNFVMWDFDAAIQKVRVPILVLQSTGMTPLRDRYKLAPGEVSPYQETVLASHPDAVSLTISAGHFTMLEEPGAVNDAIDAFLDAHGLVG